MGTCFRVTGAAILLIGLQLFGVDRAYASAQPNIASNITRNTFDDQPDNLISLSAAEDSAQAFTPKDRGGPKRSRGSGTR